VPESFLHRRRRRRRMGGRKSAAKVLDFRLQSAEQVVVDPVLVLAVPRPLLKHANELVEVVLNVRQLGEVAVHGVRASVGSLPFCRRILEFVSFPGKNVLVEVFHHDLLRHGLPVAVLSTVPTLPVVCDGSVLFLCTVLNDTAEMFACQVGAVRIRIHERGRMVGCVLGLWVVHGRKQQLVVRKSLKWSKKTFEMLCLRSFDSVALFLSSNFVSPRHARDHNVSFGTTVCVVLEEKKFKKILSLTRGIP
jgi:hypothetical protein